MPMVHGKPIRSTRLWSKYFPYRDWNLDFVPEDIRISLSLESRMSGPGGWAPDHILVFSVQNLERQYGAQVLAGEGRL